MLILWDCYFQTIWENFHPPTCRHIREWCIYKITEFSIPLRRFRDINSSGSLLNPSKDQAILLNFAVTASFTWANGRKICPQCDASLTSSLLLKLSSQVPPCLLLEQRSHLEIKHKQNPSSKPNKYAKQKIEGPAEQADK